MRATDTSLKPTDDARLQSRGTTQTGVRLYNERLLLSLIRRHGQLPKAEIARLTELSPQTVSVIVRQLEKDQLVTRGSSVKGKVGQPLQPFSLNPEGAFSIGLKVGRRSTDVLLMGLDGKVIRETHHTYDFPVPDNVLRLARDGVQCVTAGLDAALRPRIAGIGIAAPFDLWKWRDELGAPAKVMEAWRSFDLKSEIEKISAWPVSHCNDATAACAAELFFGKGREVRNYGYLYIGYFAGGGVVINGRLHQGSRGNAGALGSLPVPAAAGGSEQLLRSASSYLLEHSLHQAGQDPGFLWSSPDDWSKGGAILDGWIARAGPSLALAATSLVSILDCETVIIDGAMPAGVRDRLVEAATQALPGVNLDGISPFSIEAGTIGSNARALGAASLPMFANFMTDRDVLFANN